MISRVRASCINVACSSTCRVLLSRGCRYFWGRLLALGLRDVFTWLRLMLCSLVFHKFKNGNNCGHEDGKLENCRNNLKNDAVFSLNNKFWCLNPKPSKNRAECQDKHQSKG